MHRLRTISDVVRFRMSAFLFVGSCLLALAAAGFLIHSLMSFDSGLTLIGLGFLILVLLLILVQWITASGASCPLCRTAVLAPKLCMKHRHARSLLGSYRLRVAGSILFINQFRCPYCNESTAVAPREAQR